MDFTCADDIEWKDAPRGHFTGRVQFGPIYSPEDPADLAVLGVHFSPGSRTDWHTHPGGQVIYVTNGLGWVVNSVGHRQHIAKGDVVYAPPGEVHWHGAQQDTDMTHLSLTWNGATQWGMPKVTDAEYDA